MPNIFFYKLSYDAGQAPNPFGGVMTFSCCMHEIRALANLGDWIVGLGSKRLDQKIVSLNAREDLFTYDTSDEKIIYAMQVTDLKSFPEYFNYISSAPGNHPLKIKIPKLPPTSLLHSKEGDSIYKFAENKVIAQPSLHLNGKMDDIDGLQQEAYYDIIFGKNVLLSSQFVYFGREFKKIESPLSDLVASLDLRIIEGTPTYTSFACVSSEQYPFLEQYLSSLVYAYKENPVLAEPCINLIPAKKRSPIELSWHQIIDKSNLNLTDEQKKSLLFSFQGNGGHPDSLSDCMQTSSPVKKTKLCTY